VARRRQVVEPAPMPLRGLRMSGSLRQRRVRGLNDSTTARLFSQFTRPANV
jgi:hypothetical protein